jgi:tetratricopeptide (TPR) repeat protein
VSATRAAALATAVAIGALGATAGRATAERFWDTASRSDHERAADASAQASIEEGDASIVLAADPAARMSTAERLRLGGQAIAAYEAALLAAPTSPSLRAEARYRAGAARYALQVECGPALAETPTCRGSRAEAAEVVLAHWHAFTELAPLDPRASPLLFERAVLHTRMLALGTAEPERHLRAAAADYQARIDREVGTGRDLTSTMGNLAETYMMLGDLEQSITAYEAIGRVGRDASTSYGLAVALDRDGQGARARDLIRSMGFDAFASYRRDVEVDRKIFYVPEGERFYYFALIEQALGLDASALEDWDRFIASGAYPRFADRARTHRGVVAARLAASLAQATRGPRAAGSAR